MISRLRCRHPSGTRRAGFARGATRCEARLDGLVIQQRDAPVANAYLVEAIEDTILEFAEFSGRRSLYIFSDMMQHATWHSQPEGGVEYGGSGDPRDAQISLFPLPHAVDDLRVKIFYVPRRGVTRGPADQSRAQGLLAGLLCRLLWNGYRVRRAARDGRL